MPLPKGKMPPLENNNKEPQMSEQERAERLALMQRFELTDNPETFEKIYQDSKKINEFKLRESMSQMLPKRTSTPLTPQEKANIKRIKEQRARRQKEEMQNNRGD